MRASVFDFDSNDALPALRTSAAAEIAWVLLMVDGLVLGCTALYWTAWGHFFDPGYYAKIGIGNVDNLDVVPSFERSFRTAVRLAGFATLMLSVFVIAVSTTSFRRGERWAWYAMWTVPFLAALDFGMLAGYRAVTPLSVAWDGSVFMLGLVALVIPYQRFFPSTPAVRSTADRTAEGSRVS